MNYSKTLDREFGGTPWLRVADEMLAKEDLVTLARSYENEVKRGAVYGTPKRLVHHKFEWERGWITEANGETGETK